MVTRSTFSRSPQTGRRIITGLALLAYVASTIGYPLPLPAGDQDTSTPYPCQGHACGCNSAAQCWDNCCCYTPAERLAWVRSHNVALPAATIAALEAEAGQTTATASKSCCQSKPQVAKSDASGECDASKSESQSCGHHAESSQASPATKSRIGWINGVQAQKCQGLTTLWLVSGANLPVAIPTLWEFDWNLLGQVVPANDNFSSADHQPPVPPPWNHAA